MCLVYIDDDVDLARIFQRIFRKTRHQIYVFHRVSEALPFLTQALEARSTTSKTAPQVDGVLCDLNMPGGGGDYLFRELLELFESRNSWEQKLIFCTGGVFTNEMQDFLDTHKSNLLHKPFSLADLQGLVRHWSRLQATVEVASLLSHVAKPTEP